MYNFLCFQSHLNPFNQTKNHQRKFYRILTLTMYSQEAGSIKQQVGLPPVWRQHVMWVPAGSWQAPLPIQPHAKCTWKGRGGSPDTWAPALTSETQRRLLDLSWPGPISSHWSHVASKPTNRRDPFIHSLFLFLSSLTWLYPITLLFI